MIVLMLVIFYLFLILPENKKKKKLNEMRSNLKVGDDIVGGMMGKVVHVTDDSVTFETSEDQVRIQVAKWAISTNARAEAQAAKEAQERKAAKQKAKETKKEEPKHEEPKGPEV
jgi:preprotein translocase subunit YajC